MSTDQGASAKADRATRPTDQAPAGLGDTASVPCAFTVADVLAWAQTKPAEQTYNYLDNCGCAVAQFLRDTRRAEHPVVYSDPAWKDGEDGISHPYPVEVDSAAAVSRYPRRFEWTFGELVEGLEQIAEAARVSA